MIKTQNIEYISLNDTIGKVDYSFIRMYHYLANNGKFNIRIINTKNNTSIDWAFDSRSEADTVLLFLRKQSIKTLITLIKEG